MPVSREDLQSKLSNAFPNAMIRLTDLAGDNDHWKAEIIDQSFAGMPRVKQHQTVYRALGEEMKGPLHALQLVTRAPTSDEL